LWIGEKVANGSSVCKASSCSGSTIVEAGRSREDFRDHNLEAGYRTTFTYRVLTFCSVESERIFLNVVSDVDHCISENCLYIPYLIWVVSNMVPVVIGSILVTYVEVSYRLRDVWF